MEIVVHNPNNLPLIDYRKVKPLQGNLKDLSEDNHKKLLNVLKRRGFKAPLFVWQKGDDLYLMDGHQRQKVMIDEDMQPYKVPYLLIEAENIKDAKAQLLEITSQYGTITQQGLDAYLEQAELPQAEVVGMVNFDALSFTQEEPEVEEDEPPEVSSDPPKSKLGEIYQLGRHRLMCGDSTDRESVEQLMNGQKADMVFTDPPYGMDLDADYTSLSWGDRKGKKYEDVIGDRDDFTPELITSIFDNFSYCHELFLWGADYYYELIPDFKKGHYIVWDKTLESNGDAGSNSEYELLWTKQRHKRTVLHFNWFRYFGLGKQDIKTREHPTQKPLQVCEPIIKQYSKRKDIIVDLYLGSGSTLIACEQADRTCYGMELDPRYCDVIRKRYHKYVADSEEGWEEATPAIERKLSEVNA